VQVASPTAGPRARQIRGSPLPVAQEYRSACERAGKGGQQIERRVISTFQIAESMGFKGDFRQWEDLLRIGD
jgi:hypothetical protein